MTLVPPAADQRLPDRSLDKTLNEFLVMRRWRQHVNAKMKLSPRGGKLVWTLYVWNYKKTKWQYESLTSTLTIYCPRKSRFPVKKTINLSLPLSLSSVLTGGSVITLSVLSILFQPALSAVSSFLLCHYCAISFSSWS